MISLLFSLPVALCLFLSSHHHHHYLTHHHPPPPTTTHYNYFYYSSILCVYSLCVCFLNNVQSNYTVVAHEYHSLRPCMTTHTLITTLMIHHHLPRTPLSWGYLLAPDE